MDEVYRALKEDYIKKVNVFQPKNRPHSKSCKLIDLPSYIWQQIFSVWTNFEVKWTVIIQKGIYGKKCYITPSRAEKKNVCGVKASSFSARRITTGITHPLAQRMDPDNINPYKMSVWLPDK